MNLGIIWHVTIIEGSTNFLKIWKPPSNCRCQKGDLKQVPYWESTVLEWLVNLFVLMHFLLIVCELIHIFCIGEGVRTAVSMLTILDTTLQITHQYDQAYHICTLLLNSWMLCRVLFYLKTWIFTVTLFVMRFRACPDAKINRVVVMIFVRTKWGREMKTYILFFDFESC